MSMLSLAPRNVSEVSEDKGTLVQLSSSFLPRDVVKPGTSLRPKCKVGLKGREKGVITANSSHRGPLAVTTKGTKLQFLPRECAAPRIQKLDTLMPRYF